MSNGNYESLLSDNLISWFICKSFACCLQMLIFANALTQVSAHWLNIDHSLHVPDTMNFCLNNVYSIFTLFTKVRCKKPWNISLFTILICCLIVLICHRAPTLFAHALHDPVIGFADGRLWFLSAKPNARHQFPVFNTCILPPPPLLSFHHPSWTLFQDELPEPTHGSLLSSQEGDCKKLSVAKGPLACEGWLFLGFDASPWWLAFPESHLLKRLEFQELRRKSNEFVGKKTDLLLW